ncbi:uncharacterized protein MONOS_14054 [Monocercomonoides exilis]|uniref:uncharacterized protein n=1 Tax=Monocercomonoides exilis TaxID=2049356 RepID=UPI003559F6BD|nr:hypothetical protein MONOS_14054 [Monocercomonoides exilis]|eukprot:MONOS_14054.1-p1 / transcript=MONOS_14054.1 / gene=MONOS_14054 / organism=Monocercomonoides_exilis_PA203 / gene_product=unspecified product / transcript_product=unspecified product / location=Mono_scaffold00928:9863-10810(+) / protein_length=252 / sequence_SO=supercontig / SO=protein_coding / is_pseudo=false
MTQSSSVINDLLKSLNEYHIKLLEDLSVVYNNAPLHTQTTMLQALSRNTSLSDLQDYGYDVTEGKFIYAKQTLKKNQGFIIPPQKPHLPSCKSGLNEQDWEKGNNWMLAHSTEASTSLQSAKKKQRAEPDYARFIDEDAWENEIVTENHSSKKEQSSSSSTSSQLNKNSKTISEKKTSSFNSSSSQVVDAPIRTPIRRERGPTKNQNKNSNHKRHSSPSPIPIHKIFKSKTSSSQISISKKLKEKINSSSF